MLPITSAKYMHHKFTDVRCPCLLSLHRSRLRPTASVYCCRRSPRTPAQVLCARQRSALTGHHYKSAKYVNTKRIYVREIAALPGINLEDVISSLSGDYMRKCRLSETWRSRDQQNLPASVEHRCIVCFKSGPPSPAACDTRPDSLRLLCASSPSCRTHSSPTP